MDRLLFRGGKLLFMAAEAPLAGFTAYPTPNPTYLLLAVAAFATAVAAVFQI